VRKRAEPCILSHFAAVQHLLDRWVPEDSHLEGAVR
jgi:hypothetical protein